MLNKIFNFIYKHICFFKGFALGFGCVLFALMILAAIDAQICAQERANLHEQKCLFSFNCR